MDKMYGKPIGRVLATEKAPTTIDKFCFWTDCNFRLSAFDVIKVVRSDASITFGVVENISHITDAQSYLTNYVSSDFGNAELVAPTLRVGMNYVNAKVSHNTKGNNTPCHNDDKVYLADESEIIAALGLDKIKNPLVCGQLTMYQNTDNPVTLPVKLDAQFLLGPEGAHLNISGISGLAAKTSYAMFLLKSIQDYNKAKQKATEEESYRVDNKSTAFVIFNVKGKDLLAIDQYNEFAGNNDESETKKAYQDLGLRAEPFGQVKYFVPYTSNGSGRQSTYLTKQEQDQYLYQKKLQKYKYTYEEDRASIEMMFANIDDPLQTMESIISKVIDENDADFSKQTTWNGFLSVVGEKSQKSTDSKAKDEISIMSWRKFKRVISKAIKNDDMFASRAQQENNECRLQESIKQIKSNDVYVIDIAKLSEDKQAFVFGDCLKTIYELKQDVFAEEGVVPPDRIVVFIDELNKYAGREAPKQSPILKGILDVTERGRSLGVVLFGAEQFRSDIHDRVTGNCATHAYGRTNAIETSKKNYSFIPDTYKNMLTRLEQGEYIIQNPVFRSLLKINFPKPIYKQFK